MRKKILLIGSSMTERSFSLEHHGWGANLANWYARTADILNRGAGGYNSRWSRIFLKKQMENVIPHMTIIFIGNNDSIIETQPQHVPLDEYRDNVIAMVEYLYSLNPSMAIILLTTTAVNEQIKPNHSNLRRAQYADEIRSIVANQDSHEMLSDKPLICVDLWQDDVENGVRAISPEDMHDGMHLNKHGNKKLFEAIKFSINKHFRHLSPDFAHTVIKAKCKPSDFEGIFNVKTQTQTKSNTAKPMVKGRQGKQDHEEEEEKKQGGGNESEDVLQLTVPRWRALL
jgi:isoamyl acetate esterase